MEKIVGIKSVDFKIEASGWGVVNWNGGFKVKNPNIGDNGEYVNNHLFPKMRGVDPMKVLSLDSSALANAKLIVSQNCFRHQIFRNETENLKSVTTTNVLNVLCSIIGVVRGYVITDGTAQLSLKRKSCLLLEDLIDNNAILRYEQFTNSGERNDTSIFSKTNVDETNYLAYGSIVIEDLQFIPLEDSFGRSAYKNILALEDAKEVEMNLNEFLKSLDFEETKNPQAIFTTNYVRKGSIMKNEGEAGLLLNEDAIDLVVEEILERIRNVFIKQAKGHLEVNKLLVDYNSSNKAMRIKRDESIINSYKNENYAVFYNYVNVSDREFNERSLIRKKNQEDSKSKKSKGNKPKEIKEE